MEENVFPSPAVARELKENFIEARLHTDGDTNIDRILDLQQELVGARATPFYVLVDPETGAKLRVQDRPTTPEGFIAFLRGSE